MTTKITNTSETAAAISASDCSSITLGPQHSYSHTLMRVTSLNHMKSAARQTTALIQTTQPFTAFDQQQLLTKSKSVELKIYDLGPHTSLIISNS